jgi:hypothetical protein
MASDRDSSGRFVPGNPGGPGRPLRRVELDYLKAVRDGCSLDDIRTITMRAVQQAKDGDSRARDWLSRYLLGTPIAVAPKLSDLAFQEESGDDPISRRVQDAAQMSDVLKDLLV